MIRKDWNDQIFRTEKEKNKAIIDKVADCNSKGQPILIGTTSINKSEIYSKLLKNKGIKHSVLNAKHHEKEANIIADAGKLNAITCSTNMAGRGTDIKLGGKSLNGENKEEKNKVKELGGLFVIGTERHESRRIDNQLRGRSGRQGDQGNSIFYISLEDDLMRIFGSESIDTIMKKFGLKEGESIDHPWINKALERAQKRVEGRNFDIRKTLLKFDDVMNDQRKVIFEQRKEILKSNNISKIINSFLDDLIKNFSKEKKIYERENQIDAFKAKIRPIMGRSIKDEELTNITKSKNEKFEESIREKFNEFRNIRIKSIKDAANFELEKRILLQTIDFLWRSHLQYLEHLRQVVGLRGYAAKDPLEEFKREAFKLFESLLNKIKIDLITFLNNLEIVTQKEDPIKNSNILEEKLKNSPKCLLVIKKNEKIPRNERCPETGKKYKNCCGAL
jgi:preprotein translocase subunit SecA